jgi:hypothetical protein
MRPASLRYNKRFFSAIAIYVVAQLGVTWIFKHFHPGGFKAFALALLPALPVIAIVIIAAFYIREETDEVEKALFNEAMVWGIGVTLSLATLWGFLEAFGQAPHADGYLAFPVFCFCAGVARCLIRRRYR